MKHFPYSLLVAASLFLLPLPAEASRIDFWRFDANKNQLEFTTDEDVQPRAQLISDPTRLVIDLPGIRLGRPSFTQTIAENGAIRSVRFGQFDPQTARIVVELAPGYTLDPSKVKFRGITARQWSVQLPTPELLPPTATQPTGSGSPTTPIPRLPTSGSGTNPVQAGTVIQGVQVTSDGFFVRFTGSAPQIQQQRSGDRQQITLDLQDTAIATTVSRDQLINRYGVNRIQLTQIQTSPPVARITLNVNRTSPDWQASVSNLGGVVLLPVGGIAATNPNNPTTSPSTLPPLYRLATIESIRLENNDSQLVIRADQALQYTTGWDRATGFYRITINSAKLADKLQDPQLSAKGPVLKLRLRQEDSRTVVILMQPAAGVQIRDSNNLGQRVLALDLQRSRPTLFPPSGTSPGASIPVPTPPQSPPQTPNLPRVPNGKIVVIIDPGHGGPDPGAIGIGGIYEKDIVLDIGRQVAALLEKQGVQAVLTRDSDIDLDLEPRVRMAENLKATLFVSIHANSMGSGRPDISGLETYYFDSGLELAKTIHNSVLQGTGISDRRVRKARFYVLRKTSMPSVLVETGFVTGYDDAARLSNPAYRSRMAAAIAQGVLQYIQRTARY